MDFTKDQLETGLFSPDQLRNLLNVFYQPNLVEHQRVIGPDQRQKDDFISIRVHAVLGDFLLEGFLVLELNTNSLSFYKRSEFWNTFSTQMIPKP